MLQSLFRPVLTPLMRGMFDAPIASARAWSPLALWPDGIASPGMWISPRTLDSEWQDYTGTTPVAVPGTVADTSNPVGLSLDIRAGAPDTLGPELITGTPSWAQANWTDNGGRSYSSDGSGYLQFVGATAGAHYEVTFDIADYVAGAFCVNIKTAWDATPSAAGSYSYIIVGATGISFYASGLTATINNLSVREIPGNHMLQSTSAARPLESARVNLLTYTEDFENAIWAFDIHGSGTAVKTPNYTLAPDGTMTACRLQLGGVNASGDGAWLQHRPDLYSYYRKKSVWAKSNTANSYVMTMFPGSGGSAANVTVTPEWQRITYPALSQISWGFDIGLWFGDGTASSCDISIWHPQTEYGSTLTDYQPILTNGSSYSATGITPFQLYDGVDDGMATASFAAGTLISGMDCMIPVRRDSVANCVAGLYNGIADATKFFGMAESASGSGCVGSGAGTPTVWVDNTQLTGGTAVTRGTLHTALTAGSYHILEFRNLDLSAWTATGFGLYASYVFPGARGDIMLYPSTASTTDKDAARQYLADKYGLTLP